MTEWESDLEEAKAGASNCEYYFRSKESDTSCSGRLPYTNPWHSLKPAAHAIIDAPNKTETKILSEPRPSHVSAEDVHFGDRTPDESRNSLLKKLLTDSMLFEPFPLGTVMSTLNATFETTGKPPYSRPYRASTDRIIIRQLIDE